MKNLFYFVPLLLVVACLYNPPGQQALSMPKDQASRDSITRASEWLIRHVQRGKLLLNGKDTNVSVIAWKDPTLAPELPDRLAGYAITDSLWASYALTLTHPKVAKELRDSLKSVDCLGNNLHEVVWQPIDAIHHKPIDADIVHGRSLGVMSVGTSSVDLRSFTMANDPDFSIGHPTLFAEHAVYQSLFEYRKGKHESARNRLRNIFLGDPNVKAACIRWDAERKLLVDFVVEPDYSKFVSREAKFCRQYSFKLATLLYACRLVAIDHEFPGETAELSRILRSVQMIEGGIPHFFDVEEGNFSIKPCPDATGEATAIFVLAETVFRD